MWAGTNLITELEESDAIRLLLARLSCSFNDCEYLFRALSKYDLEWEPNLSDIFREGLFNDVLVAVELAKLSVKIAEPGQNELEKLIHDGLVYWVDNEKPYPTELATVPHSPREKLIKALIKIRPLSYAELISYTTDSRPDVRRIAEHAFITHFESNADDYLRFISDINAGSLEISPLFFHKAFRTLAPLSSDVIKLWKELFSHNNPKIRFASMSLLDEEHFRVDEVRYHVNLMIEDDEQEIRSRASKILKKIDLLHEINSP